MQIHPWIGYLAGALFMSSGILYLISNPLDWKKFRHSGFTVIFLSEKRWEEPPGKVLNVVWGLMVYSWGFWFLMKAL